MNQKICVYTCITGNYDNLHEIKNPEKNIDYYCFTNNKNLKSKTWKIVQVKNGNLSDHLLSRKIKMLGHPIVNDNYDVSVWTDASVIWQKNITDFVSTYLKDRSFAAFKHHARNSIHEEAITCLRLRKDTKENIIKALNFLQSEHFPDQLGLYEMTVFIKKHNDPLVIKTMQIWFDTVKKYSKRDQLSFMYAVWKTNLQISKINLNVWNNPWFTTSKHNPKNLDITDCHVYFGNPDQQFDINKYYIYRYHRRKNSYKIDFNIPCETNEIEFNPTDLVGIKYQNISINPTPQRIVTFGDMLSTSCHDHFIIRAYGKFHKNQKLSFSIMMDFPTASELNQLIEYQWSQWNQYHQLEDKIVELESQKQLLQSKINALSDYNNKLSNELNDIINSKGWQALEKVRKIIHH